MPEKYLSTGQRNPDLGAVGTIMAPAQCRSGIYRFRLPSAILADKTYYRLDV